jgi:Leucine-rich repeat (LRR) protein
MRKEADEDCHICLEENNLDGTIPSEMGLFTSLNYLELRNNNLDGSVPSTEFENLTNLEILGLSENNLTEAYRER